MRKRGPNRKPAEPVQAKIQDPNTGATWSGRGRAPAEFVDVSSAGRVGRQTNCSLAVKPCPQLLRHEANYRAAEADG
ncbi:H-NS family nucleoid-associated regulatory protein [Burkholderia sp. THE68]|uniref:H-NS family nucleoid-associated regulatory protein n=1 Tax=Burkholderia sp. THE68 TaxID=758782 RepID=UPI00138956C2|nr:H-NS family nucleoid-associated regulatory protein [Burkholderia sp. THE68]